MNINSQDLRFYYYHVSSQKPIKIFITTPSKSTDYLLTAKLIDKNSFAVRNTTIYPQFTSREERQKIDFKRKNYYATELDSIGTAILTINSL